MTHDLEDLLEIIKMLEERIINLEVSLANAKIRLPVQGDDGWYWEHG